MEKKWTRNSTLSFDVGELDDSERCCCKGKRGCRKNICWPRTILSLVVVDTLLFTLLWAFIVFVMTYSMRKDLKNQAAEADLRRVVRNVSICWSPLWVIFVVKLIYGWKWIRKGRTRTTFLPFYRISITHAWTLGLASI